MWSTLGVRTKPPAPLRALSAMMSIASARDTPWACTGPNSTTATRWLTRGSDAWARTEAVGHRTVSPRIVQPPGGGALAEKERPALVTAEEASEDRVVVARHPVTGGLEVPPY